MSRRRIRLDLAYDGTAFNGWQVQKKGRTVQGLIEEALERIHSHPVRLTGSGRTDSGVHARFQPAHFDTDKLNIEPQKFSIALNSMLPGDVRVIRSYETAPDFHARFQAVERGYRYYILPGRNALPFHRDFCWETRRNHRLDLLNRYAGRLLGQHDFSAFAAAGDASPSKVRIITSASFIPEGDMIVFQLSGNAFLWKMVRSLTGTLLELEKAEAHESRISEILESRDRSQGGTTAPARGLFLDFVRYPGEPGGTGFEYEELK